LSVEHGRVDVSWALALDESGREHLRLDWRESGGPEVATPERRGFGRMMLEDLVPRALRGRSELRFERSGLTWTLDVPGWSPAP